VIRSGLWLLLLVAFPVSSNQRLIDAEEDNSTGIDFSTLTNGSVVDTVLWPVDPGFESGHVRLR